MLSRILLKISGEALCGEEGGHGLDPATVRTFAEEIGDVHSLGCQVGIVIGGGNIFRGLKGAASGMDRVSADYMGMLATVINGIALQDALEKHGVVTRLMSAISVSQVAESYIRRRAQRHLEKGRVVVFVAGTGNPYFSTDTAAALRAMEIDAQALCKGTKVEGVYNRDPKKHADAELQRHISYDDFLQQRIGVMDATAIALCRDNNLPVRVFALKERGNIRRVVEERPDVGTIIGG